MDSNKTAMTITHIPKYESNSDGNRKMPRNSSWLKWCLWHAHGMALVICLKGGYINHDVKREPMACSWQCSRQAHGC